VDLEARVWIDDARRRPAIADEITGRVKRAFDESGIEIPYPKRDLYLRGLPDGFSFPPPPSPGAGERPPE
jgi:small-conductance mechanosensitive channel